MCDLHFIDFNIMSRSIFGSKKELIVVHYFSFLQIHLGINGKMPKGYKELIHENTTTIPTSTNMSISKSPHATTLQTAFTHPKSVSFHNGGRKRHLGGAYLHFLLSPKEVKASTFVHISLKCSCLWNTTSTSQIIASYWHLRVCKSINHVSLTNSSAFCLTFWDTHLHIAFHNTQITKEDIVDETLSSTKHWIVIA